ncbi:hypothetical protein FYK55_17245 [Roseiconus nitratireducens]|uniref:N-sulphoglucosamine sulphohydrolase C-terminal domain-containing protein n=1 Tax=Roseiconus nitratireducens TaxID=2605748 RepID=A0A5M6D4U7_9BACT|nr:hypothetical protein [Roseiconus nitratireducens]KAA5541322.1 hypothetical protein FYK55_17245 [Roseiconus nitratireducens]
MQHPKAKPGRFQPESVELYRLDRDPGETDNLLEREAGRAESMLSQLKAWYAETQEEATKQLGGW